MSERNELGQFVEGNHGGPGRPRRAIETEYLKVLSDAVPLDAWRKIVDRAVSDAQDGDAKAREWLAQYVTGKDPASLTWLAAQEALGVTPDIYLAGRVQQLVEESGRARTEALSHIGGMGASTTTGEALDIMVAAEELREAEAEAEERARKRAARLEAKNADADKPACLPGAPLGRRE